MGIERLRYSLTYRLRALLRPAEVERDLDDEMRYHVERETAYRVARGESPAAARAFGCADGRRFAVPDSLEPVGARGADRRGCGGGPAP